ncbi:MAG: hypothetical protein ACI3ZD_04245 [Prevotella sp.]
MKYIGKYKIPEYAIESLTGYSAFYENIGIDTQLCISNSREIIRNKYHI